MFKKTTNNNLWKSISRKFQPLLVKAISSHGDLQGSSVIRIEGKIIGNVNVDGGVVLGEKGNIEGDITTKSAIIYGTVNGNIKTTQLEIKKTGYVNGDITTDTLEIELGAQYNGKLNMKRQQQILKGDILAPCQIIQRTLNADY